ncbi:hypothetical protein FVA95_03800 [Pseudonocardia sp. EV170527-09]|uniref:hypothetical protein n=1 Tax=Pseudonocardia sp. EV170527-09 TaxID=2603411 RepID=UPI0011F10265|nr:hypothetical protein [Pseudonocardia sp. EV170527-09]KAA1034610.1 hypothetical protein FVA95_03800 [Pseudonocardia sp. EV170527-09]
MSSRPRRVAVSAPPERATAVPRPQPAATLDPGLAERARGLRRVQLRRAVVTLACAAVLLFGLPVLLRVAPDLARWRVGGLPLGWIAVAWLPYPLLGLLAWWHLRRAERAERP